jgi:hypothetical protein
VEKKIAEEWKEIKTAVMDACKCANYNCGCCAHLQEKEIHLNSTSKNVRVKEQIFHFADSLCCIFTQKYQYIILKCVRLCTRPIGKETCICLGSKCRCGDVSHMLDSITWLITL